MAQALSGYTIVIMYSESLSSYMLYAQYIQRYAGSIAAVVCLPPLPQATTRTTHTFSTPLFKKLTKTAPLYLFFNLCTVSVYNFFAKLYGTRLQDLARTQGVRVIKASTIDTELIAQLKALSPDIIFNNSPNILNRKILKIPSVGVINYHCAPLPEYRGAANYFWLLETGQQVAWATVHFVDHKLDSGDIIIKSDEVPIKRCTSVFDVWYQLRSHAFTCLSGLHEQYFKHGVPPHSEMQDHSRAKSRSFPDKKAVRSIQKQGYAILRFRDIKKICRIAMTGILKDT